MSGHSKWSKIKRQKEVSDKIKGNTFSKLSRLITLAVVEGGGIGDPENNVRLRLAIEKAKALNMPKDNINRAIEKASGPSKSALREVIYEAFAPGGVAVLIIATTDNPNRTLSEVRNTLEKNGGKLAGQGSASYLFKRCGFLVYNKEQVSEDKVLSIASKLDAFDLNQEDNRYLIYFPIENLNKVKEVTLESPPQSMETIFKPTSLIAVGGDDLIKITRIIEELENLDDVHEVYSDHQA